MLGITALSAGASAKAGSDSAKAQKADAKYQAQQLNKAAISSVATGQRAGTEERKQAGLAVSRATALAAGSGAGATDPTVTNILGNLAGEGEYNALADLFNARSQAQDYTDSAAALKAGVSASAAATKAAGLMQGVGTAAQGASSFFSKYGESDYGATSGMTQTDLYGLGDATGAGMASGGFAGAAG
jgi:hypothetical protein